MRYCDTPRQQVQFVLNAARKFPVFDVEIFRVADDRVADMRHMRTQLMGAAGDRLERNPCHFLPCGFHHGVVGDSMNGVLLAMFGDAHEAVLLDFLLGEEGGNAPLLRLRYTGDQRPIDLARRARTESFRKRRGGKSGLGYQQASGRVLVEPVDQAWTLGIWSRPA